MTANLIEIRHLNVAFKGQAVVRDLSMDIPEGQCVALVGESGSGKSVTAHSILQLLPTAGCETTGSIRFRGQELLGTSPKVLRQLRGNRIAMIFQEPMSSLNPLHSVHKQIGETLLVHKGLAGKAARQRTLELLEMVGIQEPSPTSCPGGSDNA
jgi:microcin C transport system ATP-binding protein